jgi:hypothetical protein
MSSEYVQNNTPSPILACFKWTWWEGGKTPFFGNTCSHRGKRGGEFGKVPAQNRRQKDGSEVKTKGRE